MGAIWGGFAAQVPVIKAQIGAPDALYGSLFLVSSLGALVAMRFAGAVDRRLGARSVQVTAAAMGCAMLVPALASGPVGFAFGMVLAAAFSGLCDVLMNARTSETEEARGRPLMNLTHGLYSLSFALTAILTGLAREIGLPPVAVFGIIAALILTAAPWMIAPHRHDAGEAAHLRNPAQRGLVWLAGLVFLAGFLVEQAADGWSALHIERTLGGRAAEGAFGPAVLGLTMGLGRFCGQTLAARYRETVLITLACLVSAGGITLAALAPNVALAYAGFGLLGLGISIVVPLSVALVGRMVPPSQRVAAIGQASIIGYGAFLVGPSLMGLTSDAFGLRVAFLTLAVMLLLVAAVLMPLIAARIRASR
ncbi:MAG: MFS transporter [Pseudooceanicola sp.]|nr:MFS transporter [Pseudooceanicola sp.]